MVREGGWCDGWDLVVFDIGGFHSVGIVGLVLAECLSLVMFGWRDFGIQVVVLLVVVGVIIMGS
jgi:hypothetical protein